MLLAGNVWTGGTIILERWNNYESPVVEEDQYSKDELTNSFFCNQCGRVYKNRKTLFRHIRYECSRLKLFPCHICSYRANRRCHLKSHLASKHKNFFGVPDSK